jgi:MoaA/NifB/PqqE/SkfB family radical SAM enzyme
MINLNVPISASIEITTKCNNNCLYCFNNLHGLDEISITNFRKILDILKENNIFFIKLSGGEPLVHSKFKQISLILKKYNCFNKSIITNGLLIDKYYNIINKCYDKIGISIDGSKETHSRLRGKLSYDKIINNVDKIKIPKIMYVTISKLNYKNIGDIIKIGELYHFGSIVFLYYKPIGLGTKSKGLLHLTEKIKISLKHL